MIRPSLFSIRPAIHRATLHLYDTQDNKKASNHNDYWPLMRLTDM